MGAVLLAILVIPAVILTGGVIAFILLPVKAGIAVAVIAFVLAASVLSWMVNSIDLSH